MPIACTEQFSFVDTCRKDWLKYFTIRGFVSSSSKTFITFIKEHFYKSLYRTLLSKAERLHQGSGFQRLELPFSLQRYRNWNLNHEQTPRLLIFTSNDFVFQRNTSCQMPQTQMPFPMPEAFAFHSPHLSMLLNNNLLVYWCYHMKEKWCLHQEVLQWSKLSVCIMLNQKIGQMSKFPTGTISTIWDCCI